MILQVPDCIAENGMPLVEDRISARRDVKGKVERAYQVDVTWVPVGLVLMLEQAYSLSSGPTSTGLMASWMQPNQGV
jgi:hypothetical protein